MLTSRRTFIAASAAGFLSLRPLQAATTMARRWAELPPIPDARGVAGAFAGTDQNALLVAGGANFPDKMPWEGGTKVWHNQVYRLSSPEAQWQHVGKLPQPMGYGISISTDQGVACLGGCDATKHVADCFLLQYRNDAITTVALPPLPSPCAYSCGVQVGSVIYVAGGTADPAATSAMKNFWTLDLQRRDDGWKKLTPWPGPERMLAVAASVDGNFFLAGGTSIAPGLDGKPVRTYLRDMWKYSPTGHWSRCADLPRPAVAAPTPAPHSSDGFLILGGDDGTLVNFSPPQNHPGFPKSILKYHVSADQWTDTLDLPASHVTTPTVEWNGRFVIPSGELRPGIRSPSVWALTLQPE
jgi:N-acetylneuraminate epimerase